MTRHKTKSQIVGVKRKDGSGKVTPGRPKILRRFVAVLGLLVTLVLVLTLWTLPWLARRGDLNAIVERVISSSIHPDLVVRIERLETDSLSRLAITFMEGVETRGAEERFSFRCERLSVFYNPLDVWFGFVEDLTLLRPEIFVNLDVDVGELFKLPDVPEALRTEGGARDERNRKNVAVGHFSIQGGVLRWRYGGRDFTVDDLDLDLVGLGSRDILSFKLTARLLGATVAASGKAVPTRHGGLEFRDVTLSVGDLDLRSLVRSLPGVAGLTGGGVLDLEGSLRGTWPRRLAIDLKAAADKVEAGEGGLVHDGRVGLCASATVFGEFDRAEFLLQLGAEGTVDGIEDRFREAIDVELRGVFTRADRGVIHLDPSSRIEGRGLGAISVAGSITSLLAGPRLDLRLHLPGVELGSLREHLLGDRLPPLVLRMGGVLAADAAVRGDLDSPTVEDLRIRVEGLDLAMLPHIIDMDPGREASGARGVGTVELTVASFRPPALPDSVVVRLDIRELDLSVLDDRVGVEEASLTARFALSAGAFTASDDRVAVPTTLHIEGHARLETAGVAVGPAYDALDGETVTLEGAVTLRSGATGSAARAWIDCELVSPSTGAVAVRGTIDSGSPTRLDLELVAPAIPGRRFLEIYFRDVLQDDVTFLEGATFDGTINLDLRLRGSCREPRIAGRLRSRPLAADLPVFGLRLRDAGVDLPFNLGGPRGDEAGVARAGEVSIGELRVGDVSVTNILLPLEFDGREYRLAGKVTPIDLLGGSVAARSLRVDTAPGRLELDIAATGLDLARVGQILGLEGLTGTLRADFPVLSLDRDQITLRGGLSLDVFGGEVALKDVTITDWVTPYATFSLGAGWIRDLDLRELGETFNVGLMSGVLEGSIENLVFIPGAVSEFDVDLRTVKRAGVPQYVSPRAIESIKQAISGPLASLGDVFFSSFRYEGFGFRATLRRNRFGLRGNFEINGVELLMYGRWWQFPRIRIVNGRPGKTYDWRRIWENLRRLYDRGENGPDGQ